jgi:uncharacterized protein YaiL (DUF2058 family)
MSKSLQDQLLNTGLVNKNQVKKVKSDKRKQQRTNNADVVNDHKLSAQQALAEKTAHDRELNQKKQQQAEQKAITAQIKQLIKLNSQPQDKEGDAYHFSDDSHVKTIYVSETMREQLSHGKMAIVKLNNKYEVVPTQVAEKISLRNNQYIVQINERKDTSETNADDPYADFQIPDDLMW